MLHILTTMAGQVDIPAEDVAQGRASPGYDATGPAGEAARLIRIQSSKKLPADAYVSVYYRNHWFWIDDRDLRSKRSFAFMMLLFTLAEPDDKTVPPVLTIPTQ
jgi:hypothetical protein